MTPQQALSILTQVTAAIPTNREQHLQILKALEVIHKILEGEKKCEP